MQYKKINFLGDFLNGKFVLSNKPDGQFKDESPGDLSDQILTAQYTLDHIEKACHYAKEAYLPWARLSLEDRKKYILKLKEIFYIC